VATESKVRKIIDATADQKQLHAAYKKIYRKKTRLRAWYIFEYNTVYLNVRDLHEGILAHELAHSIIDNYLSTRPPPTRPPKSSPATSTSTLFSKPTIDPICS